MNRRPFILPVSSTSVPSRPSRDVIAPFPNRPPGHARPRSGTAPPGHSFPVDVCLAFLCGLLLLAGCAGSSAKTCQAPAAPAFQDGGPRRMAILPFIDHTDTEGLATLVRRSLYAQTSLLPFLDIELSQVDRLLQSHGLEDQGALHAVPAPQLGRILHCDVLVYGEVTSFERVFAGVYSSLSVGALIQVWDIRTGRRIWRDEYTARSQEGGLPLTLVDLPLISVRSGMNLRETVKIQAIDDLTRRLAERMPAPPVSAGASSHASREGPYEIRVAAFSDPERAVDFQRRLSREGFTASVVPTTDREGRLLHRVVVGPYPERAAAVTAGERLRRLFPRCDAWIARSSHSEG